MALSARLMQRLPSVGGNQRVRLCQPESRSAGNRWKMNYRDHPQVGVVKATDLERHKCVTVSHFSCGRSYINHDGLAVNTSKGQVVYR